MTGMLIRATKPCGLSVGGLCGLSVDHTVNQCSKAGNRGCTCFCSRPTPFLCGSEQSQIGSDHPWNLSTLAFGGETWRKYFAKYKTDICGRRNRLFASVKKSTRGRPQTHTVLNPDHELDLEIFGLKWCSVLGYLVLSRRIIVK